MKNKILICFYFIIQNIIQIISLQENSDIIKETINIRLYKEEEKEYEIKLNKKTYIFEIDNEKYLYFFYSKSKNVFYTKNADNTFKNKLNGTYFKKGEKVYVNPFNNLTKIKFKLQSLPIYNELNSFQTVKEDQEFCIESKEKSMVYFDSFDRNSKVYISEIDKTEEESKNEKRINGKFHIIEGNKKFKIRNMVFNYSVFQTYFFPLDLENKTINIRDINFLYLQKGKSYVLNFKENTINKMLKLSTKTFDAQISINKNGNLEEKALNRSNPYYKVNGDLGGELTLEVNENDAFIEILSNTGDYEILNDISLEKYKINKKLIIIKIPMTQKSFSLQFNSSQNLSYSLSYGLTIDENYYYTSTSDSNINIQEKNETLIYLSLFKNIEVLQNEFLSFVINFEKEENQDIYLSYIQFSPIDEILDEDMPKEKCENIIKYIQEALELYVYLDIAKNPPNPKDYPNYFHRKIDLKSEIGNISTTNRKFYEFYQEIERILTTTKDLHFLIAAKETDKGIQFWQYSVFLPFSFEVREYEGEFRIFIKKGRYFKYFDDGIKKIIESHLNKPLKSINDIDPFDYIQNFSLFSSCKNPHAEFTHIIGSLHEFYLYYYPFNYSNLTSNEYEFEDNTILRLSYFLLKPNINDDTEFNEFFMKTIKSYKLGKHKPLLDEIRDQYLEYKGKKKKSIPKIMKENNKIKWDIEHIEYEGLDYYFKCRVDKENHVNVFVQNTFDFNYNNAIGKIFDCTKLFHTNNYPIIIIESKNSGGNPYFSLLMIQLFQMRPVERIFSAYRMSKISKKFLKDLLKDQDLGFSDSDTCEIINSIEDMETVTDRYINKDDNNNNIKHKRTKTFTDVINESHRKGLNEFREHYVNSTFLKKPTEIIIFTDAFSFSATSSLIKGFQNIGGAITVGYFGNPKIEGTHLFDASQADSGVYDIKKTELYYNLAYLGYEIMTITIEEAFDDYYHKGNPIPREYIINPVDYRVHIYSEYSDDIYAKFISEGKKIFNKFNNEGYCNPENDRLVMHNDDCINIPLKEHAHGGYKCGSNKKWDTNECKPYYCDIGFSFDQYYRACKGECLSDAKVFFIHENDYHNNYINEKNETYQFILIKPVKYVFQSSEDNIEKHSKIYFVSSYDEVTINKYKNSSDDFSVTIAKIETDIEFSNYRGDGLYYEEATVLRHKTMLIFQSSKDHYIFLDNIFNFEANKIKYINYKKEIPYTDIINLNEKYYTDFSGDIFHLNKNDLYILYLDYNYSNEINNEVIMSINPIDNELNISFKESMLNFFVLEKEKDYTINLPNNSPEVLIKLSRKIDSEILIEEKETLNSNNRYYHLDGGVKQLKIKTNENDALMEVLFNLNNFSDFFTPSDVDIININSNNELKLTNMLNLIVIEKKQYLKITFEIQGSEFPSYSIYLGYSKVPYSHFFDLEMKDVISETPLIFKITEPYKREDKVLEDEYYCVFIFSMGDPLDVIINIEEIAKRKQKHYILILIPVSCAISILIIIVIVTILFKGKKEIKELEENLNSLN